MKTQYNSFSHLKFEMDKKRNNNKTNNNVSKLEIKKSKIFEVAVVSTMSSGKSTFINALIGTDLLPSQNQACTTRTTAILDNDNAKSTTAHLLLSNKEYKQINDCSADQISNVLKSEDKSILDIIIESNIPGIKNAKRSLLIVDTPGVNNIANLSHEKKTYNYLKSLTSGLIIYVLNAEQIGTTDDSHVLETLKTILNTNPALQLIFVLNKADQLDPEKEPIDKVVSNCIEYLCSFGIENPSIFPVSSAAALLFKRAISSNKFNKQEAADFKKYYDTFEPRDFNLASYVIHLGKDAPLPIIINENEYNMRDIQAALENTGIPAVEREIEKRIIDKLNSKAPKIKNPNQK